MKYEIYSGAGNDFVMIDNIDGSVPIDKQSEFTARICSEKFNKIDGVIFLDKPQLQGSLLRMNYYNRDGSYGAMCGNGARCTAQFAFVNGIVKDKSFSLEAVDKIYRADILEDEMVKLYFPSGVYFRISLDVNLDDEDFDISSLHWVYVGSEHIVVFIENINDGTVKSIDDVDVENWGRALRYHPDFQPKGANVNFVHCLSDDQINIRTYERGVERETLACGTGIVSSAIIAYIVAGVLAPVSVLVESGEELEVDFKYESGVISDLTLEGSAKKISEGEIEM